MYFYDDIFLFRQIKWLFYVISSDKIKLMFGMLDTKTIIFIEKFISYIGTKQCSKQVHISQ